MTSACKKKGLTPPLHLGEGDHHGFVSMLIKIARAKGVSAYVGHGMNRWPAVHRLDAARLYRLVPEKEAAEGFYHSVAEEGVPFRKIAEVIGRHLNVPVASKTPAEASEHFGWFANFAAIDCPASSAHSSGGNRPTPISSLTVINRTASKADKVRRTSRRWPRRAQRRAPGEQ